MRPRVVAAGLSLAAGVLCLPAAAIARPMPAASPTTVGAELPTIVVPAGFRIEKVVGGLTYPTSLAWDDAGRLYVAEAGGQFLEEPAPSRILRIENGRATVAVDFTGKGVADSVAGLTWHRGAFYFTHRHPKDRTGAVSRATLDGNVRRLFSGFLDSQSEHQIADIKAGPDGRLYLGSGPAANSAVVGVDLAAFVARSPNVHTTACRDIVLTGQNFQTPDFRTRNPSDVALTGAYVPFGTATKPGQRITGTRKCGGAIFSFDAARPEKTLRLHAWGFRNVIGLGWNASGDMFAAVNGFDVRGSRPVNDQYDATYRVRNNTWYGWPDFSANLEPLTRPTFDSPDSLQAPVFLGRRPLAGRKRLGFLIDHRASGLRVAPRSLVAGLHEFNASPSQIAFSPGSWGEFGQRLFVAEFGDLAPNTTPLRDDPAGFQVVVIDPQTKRAVPFVRNVRPGPASRQAAKGRGVERPYDVKFGPDGAMYIADYGILNVNPARIREGQVPYEAPPRSGAIWKVTPVGHLG